MTGFVYIMGNEAMPGYLKVGMTDRSPYRRAAELSASTSVPHEFDLLAVIPVDDARQYERIAHDDLREYRFNKSREFFQCSLARAAFAFQGCGLWVTYEGAQYFSNELLSAMRRGTPCGQAEYEFQYFVAAGHWGEICSLAEYKGDGDLDAYIRSALKVVMREPENA